ncbi:MAG: hypothetical protein HYY09_00950 [Firmicutes bacterium]|nr:hypothetical protein [Bacillota bacterium]
MRAKKFEPGSRARKEERGGTGGIRLSGWWVRTGNHISTGETSTGTQASFSLTPQSEYPLGPTASHLRPALPYGLADYLCAELSRSSKWTPASETRCFPLGEQVLSAARKALDRTPTPPVALEWAEHPVPAGTLPGVSSRGPDPQVDPGEILRVIEGRILLEEEIAFHLWRRRAVQPGLLVPALESLVGRSLVERGPSVGLTKGGRPFCYRCGCASGIERIGGQCCGRDWCLACRWCRPWGEARLCRPLYRGWLLGRPVPGLSSRAFEPRLPVLSDPQAAAFRELLDFVSTKTPGPHVSFLPALRRPGAGRNRMESGHPTCLVWAVCGAGKTEAVLGAVGGVLALGGRVLYTTPRRDVVLEVVPRVRGAFPALPASVFHGGRHDASPAAPLVLATTHQVLRFHRTFDLVILDEPDAFPFPRNDLLAMALERASAPGSRLILLTATPSPDLIKMVRRGEIHVVKIPARHHGHPLPEPELLRIRLPSLRDAAGSALTERAAELIRGRLPAGRRVLVFVPSVDLARKTAGLLAGYLSGVPVGYAHARAEDRPETVQDFRSGGIKILISTTILERGVSFPAVDVIVLWADQNRVFDCSTLIQLAGRAGRSAADPGGKVWFLGGRVTGTMRRARDHIREMNTLARRLGYLKTLSSKDGAS